MWINTNTQDIYRFHKEFRSAFPQTSFPRVLTDEIMSNFGVARINTIPKPLHDHTKNVVEDTPVLIDGVWTQVWNVTDASAEEIAAREESKANNVRGQRDRLLSETDWMALNDTTLTPEWAAYRQALRDITSHANFPWLNEDDWPVKPE